MLTPGQACCNSAVEKGAVVRSTAAATAACFSPRGAAVTLTRCSNSRAASRVGLHFLLEVRAGFFARCSSRDQRERLAAAGAVAIAGDGFDEDGDLQGGASASGVWPRILSFARGRQQGPHSACARI
jgi:hypothetical protein